MAPLRKLKLFSFRFRVNPGKAKNVLIVQKCLIFFFFDHFFFVEKVPRLLKCLKNGFYKGSDAKGTLIEEFFGCVNSEKFPGKSTEKRQIFDFRKYHKIGLAIKNVVCRVKT